MNRSKAERITGVRIEMLPRPKVGTAVTYAAYAEDGTEILRQTSNKHEVAIERVVIALYQRTSKRVFAEQEYRCFCCYQILPLTIDHIKMRSHGRSDVRSNLRSLCCTCHEDRHRHPHSPPIPHPEILKTMRIHGWEWGGEAQGWIPVSDFCPTLDKVEATA